MLKILLILSFLFIFGCTHKPHKHQYQYKNYNQVQSHAQKAFKELDNY